MNNKKLNLTDGVDGEKLTTAKLLAVVVGGQPAEGLTIAEMRKRLDILGKLEKANGTIELDRAELEMVAAAYRSYRFAVLHPDLVAVDDELEKAKNE